MVSNRRLNLAIGCLLSLLVLCAPLYLFFWYCPPPEELMLARSALRVGMRVEDAERLLPGRFLHVPLARAEAREPTPGASFTGYLRAVETCSDQCDGRLEVECRNGVVTGFTLELWNDFTHKATPIP